MANMLSPIMLPIFEKKKERKRPICSAFEVVYDHRKRFYNFFRYHVTFYIYNKKHLAEKLLTFC